MRNNGETMARVTKPKQLRSYVIQVPFVRLQFRGKWKKKLDSLQQHATIEMKLRLSLIRQLFLFSSLSLSLSLSLSFSLFETVREYYHVRWKKCRTISLTENRLISIKSIRETIEKITKGIKHSANIHYRMFVFKCLFWINKSSRERISTLQVFHLLLLEIRFFWNKYLIVGLKNWSFVYSKCSFYYYIYYFIFVFTFSTFFNHFLVFSTFIIIFLFYILFLLYLFHLFLFCYYICILYFISILLSYFYFIFYFYFVIIFLFYVYFLFYCYFFILLILYILFISILLLYSYFIYYFYFTHFI